MNDSSQKFSSHFLDEEKPENRFAMIATKDPMRELEMEGSFAKEGLVLEMKSFPSTLHLLRCKELQFRRSECAVHIVHWIRWRLLSLYWKIQ